MAKEVMLFDFSKQGFLSLGWRLQMKYVYSKNLLVHELKFPVKKKIFDGLKILYPNPGCYTGKMLFVNASKIIRN